MAQLTFLNTEISTTSTSTMTTSLRLVTTQERNGSLLLTRNNAYLCTEEAIDLIDKLLVYDHAHRILPKEAMKHPYFNQVRKEDEIRLKRKAVDSRMDISQ